MLERLLPFRAPANRQLPQSSQIAMAILRQLEADEAQYNVPVSMDHQHIHSIAYRGAFLLAAVTYIEVGIFFVADLSPGIKGPLIRLGVAFFVLNPLLQLLWVQYALWISRMNWSRVAKNTFHGVTFGASMFISVNEFLRVSMKSKSDNREPLYSTSTSYLTLGGGLMLSVTVLGNNLILEGKKGLPIVSFCIFYPLSLIGLCYFTSARLPGIGSPIELTCNLGFCLCLELFYYGYEWLLESRNVTPKYAFYLRCGLLFCFLGSLVVLQLLAPFAPSTTILSGSITVSAAIWSLSGTIFSLYTSRRTVIQDESPASSPETDRSMASC